MPITTHPTNRTLIAYLDGEMLDDERVEIAGHVGKCAVCQSDLDYMEADLDWFLVLEAAARPIESRPQPGGLGLLLAATRQWRNTHPDVASDGAADKRRAVEQQTVNALEVLLGPTLAAAVRRQDAAGNAESLLAAFLGRHAAAELMIEIRRGNLDRCLASGPS